MATPVTTARGPAGTIVQAAEPARAGLLVVTSRVAEAAGAPIVTVAAAGTGTNGARGTIVVDSGTTGEVVTSVVGRVTVGAVRTIVVNPGGTGEVATSVVGPVTVAVDAMIARGTAAADAMIVADRGGTAEAGARAVGPMTARGDAMSVADPVTVAAVGTRGQALTTIASRPSSVTGCAAVPHACPRSHPGGQSPPFARA